jgi:hypothetical protein
MVGEKIAIALIDRLWGSARLDGAEPCHHTTPVTNEACLIRGPWNPEPRFQLDRLARPFTIDEYLCIMMDKYASTEEN